MTLAPVTLPDAQILGFCYVFCAIAVASANDCDGDGCSRALGFYGVWDMFLVVILAVGGTLVMRMVRAAVVTPHE